MAKSSHKARRTAARLAAAQSLYLQEVGEGSAARAAGDVTRLRQQGIAEELVEPDAELLAAISEGAAARQAEIDSLISGALDGRPIERADALLRAILRAGAFELLTAGDTPAGVVINDYVNVAHAFYEAGEPAKVNAVLDRIARQLDRA